MARYKRKKSHRSGSKKLPLAIVVPMAATGYKVGKMMMAGDTGGAVLNMTGIANDGSFHSEYVVRTYAPMLAGVIVHKGAARLGVNRYLPKWLPVSI